MLSKLWSVLIRNGLRFKNLQLYIIFFFFFSSVLILFIPVAFRICHINTMVIEAKKAKAK